MAGYFRVLVYIIFRGVARWCRASHVGGQTCMDAWLLAVAMRWYAKMARKIQSSVAICQDAKICRRSGKAPVYKLKAFVPGRDLTVVALGNICVLL